MLSLKYNFEYGCYSIWLEENNENPIYENISVENLQINHNLKDEIKKLEIIYHAGYNETDPIESGIHDIFLRCIFINRVLLSSQLLKIELNNKYEVIFDKDYWEENLLNLLSYLNNESPI